MKLRAVHPDTNYTYDKPLFWIDSFVRSTLPIVEYDLYSSDLSHGLSDQHLMRLLYYIICWFAGFAWASMIVDKSRTEQAVVLVRIIRIMNIRGRKKKQKLGLGMGLKARSQNLMYGHVYTRKPNNLSMYRFSLVLSMLFTKRIRNTKEKLLLFEVVKLYHIYLHCMQSRLA